MPNDNEQIFHAAARIHDRDARVEYLKSVPEQEPEWFENMVKMLDAHFETSGLLAPGDLIESTVESETGVNKLSRVVGRYKLLQTIGEGGFGTVYLAEQVDPVRRQVALKIIKPGMDTREVIARFEAERQALAMMDHPNIARVLDGGQTESGHPYFVMELVRGDPITAYCDRHKLPFQERLELFITVCNAIQHAHQKGIIHRDIKPSNVLVTVHDGKPVPKVIDFGVAKAISQQLTEKTLFTAYGQIIGTPSYMSPEQTEMSGLDIDTRSDIYSLGVLLYELLTGQPPLDATRLKQTSYAELVRMIQEEEPVAPSRCLSLLGDSSERVCIARRGDTKSLTTALRGELDWIVMRALEKERERRYESAKGIGKDVQRYLNDDPVEAGPPSKTYRLRKVLKRHRGLVASATAFAILLIAGIIGTTSGWYLKSKEAYDKGLAIQDADTSKRIAQKERDNAQLANSSLKRTLFAADMNLAMTAWEKNDLIQMRMLLDKYRNDATDEWEWRFLDGLQRSARPKNLLAVDHQALRVYTIPNSREFAITHPQGDVFSIVDPISKRVRSYGSQTPGDWHFAFVAVHPSGKRLLFPSDDYSTLRELDLATGEINNDLPVPDRLTREQHRVSAARFSPDGKLLAVAIPDKGIALVQRDTSEFGDLIPLAGIRLAEEFAFSPDGSRLAITSDPVTLIDVSNGEPLITLDGHRSAATSLQFIRDGKWIVTGSRDRSAVVWDAETGERVRTLGPFDSEVRSIAYDRDSGRLAIGVRDRRTFVFSIPEFERLQETRSYDGLYGLQFQEDGTILSGAFGGGVTQMNTVDQTGSYRVRAEGRVYQMSFLPGSKRLIYTTKELYEGSQKEGRTRLRTMAIGNSSEPPLDLPILEFNVACFDVAEIGGTTLLAVCDTDSPRVVVVEMKQGDPDAVTIAEFDEATWISSLRFSVERDCIFLGTDSGSLWKHDLNFPKAICTPIPGKHKHRITSICPYQGGFLSGDGDGNLSVYSRDDRLQSFTTRKAAPGTWIRGLSAVGSDYSYGLFGPPLDGNRIFFVRDGADVAGFYGHTFSIHDTVLIRGGKTLVTQGGDREIKFWSTDTLTQQLAIREKEIFTCMAVSPDETMIAAGTREGSIFFYHAPKQNLKN